MLENILQYFVALIIGVILLGVLWQTIIALFQGIPGLNRYGIVIAIVVALALFSLAKYGTTKYIK
jgi:hypothetical protein